MATTIATSASVPRFGTPRNSKRFVSILAALRYFNKSISFKIHDMLSLHKFKLKHPDVTTTKTEAETNSLTFFYQTWRR